MGEVIYANIETSLPVPVDRVLEGARDANLTEVLVLGVEQDGSFYCAASATDGGGLLILLERAKALFLRKMDIL